MAHPDSPLRHLNAAGQSVWCDHIHRGMITTGGLAAMVETDDLRGITSNPSIFDKAISSTHEYDELIQQELDANAGMSSRELFFALAIRDIKDACDVMRPVHDATNCVDGKVSLEVSPDLADDCDATVREARELWARLDRPNAMIKVPATEACLPAIETLIEDGLNVNVTLLFSVERYEAVAEAYIRGLERRRERGLPLVGIASVASFFISRVDGALDPQLAEKAPALQGKLAIANAKVAYTRFQEIFSSQRFAALEAAGAGPQRLLWASTSTKNPNYPELLYVESLIGPQTVNTMPPATYEAFRESGVVANTLEAGIEEAQESISALASHGIDLNQVTQQLERDGVAIFDESFQNLLHHLETKASALSA